MKFNILFLLQELSLRHQKFGWVIQLPGSAVFTESENLREKGPLHSPSLNVPHPTPTGHSKSGLTGLCLHSVRERSLFTTFPIISPIWG